MPDKALKFCSHSGCGVLTRERFCPEHKKLWDIQQAQREKAYDYERGSSGERGYDGDWQKFRIYKLMQEPLCELCLERNIIRPATLVHHLVPLKDGGERLRLENTQSLCSPCHEEIEGPGRWRHQAPEWYPAQFLRPLMPVTVVCGPPGSGKTTYIEQHKEPRDLVIDVDEIIAHLSGLQLYAADFAKWIDAACHERNRLINSLSYPSNYPRAWIISTSAYKWQRDYWREKLEARVIVMETYEHECLRRLNNDARRPQSESARAARRVVISRWWKNYQRSECDTIIR